VRTPGGLAGFLRDLDRAQRRSEPLNGRGGDRLVFDNADGGRHTFDWSLVRRHRELTRALIAGGVGPDNALEARSLGGFAIDVG
jgi:phosphoribosylanthranilate isomerase